MRASVALLAVGVLLIIAACGPVGPRAPTATPIPRLAAATLLAKDWVERRKCALPTAPEGVDPWTADPHGANVTVHYTGTAVRWDWEVDPGRATVLSTTATC